MAEGGGGSYDLEVTWSGAELELRTTKRIRIIYKPAGIVEIAWDTPEGPVDEEHTVTLQTKDLPDGANAAIEVYRSKGEILSVEPDGAAFEEAMKILVKTLNLPEGTPLTVEVYRKPLPGVATEGDPAPVHVSRLPTASGEDKDMFLSRDLDEPNDDELRADVRKVVKEYMDHVLHGINSTSVPPDKTAALIAFFVDAAWVLGLAIAPEAVAAAKVLEATATTVLKIGFNLARSSLKPTALANLLKEGGSTSPKENLVVYVTDVFLQYRENVDLASLRSWLKGQDKLGGEGSSSVRDDAIWEYCFGDRIPLTEGDMIVTEAQNLARDFFACAPRLKTSPRMFGHIRDDLHFSNEPYSKYEAAGREHVTLHAFDGTSLKEAGEVRANDGSLSPDAWIGARLGDYQATVAILMGLIDRSCFGYVKRHSSGTFMIYDFPHRRVMVQLADSDGPLPPDERPLYYEQWPHGYWDGPWSFR